MDIDRYACLVCGYVYDPRKGDPAGGVAPDTPGDKLPPKWRCPLCDAAQDNFARLDED